MLGVGSGATLTLKDSGAGGTLTGGSSNNGGSVYVAAGGAFMMNSGTLSGSSAVYGGGVYVAAGGTFTMNGGTISGNAAPGYGSGKQVSVTAYSITAGDAAQTKNTEIAVTTGYTYKVMLVSADKYVPLCEAWSKTAT
ncbi:MAG: hypothetical protein E7425_05975 [Ruminococcaceae bacterium]|nr:hypothetical protein [Oscillospiraceae bacterium]